MKGKYHCNPRLIIVTKAKRTVTVSHSTVPPSLCQLLWTSCSINSHSRFPSSGGSVIYGNACFCTRRICWNFTFIYVPSLCFFRFSCGNAVLTVCLGLGECNVWLCFPVLASHQKHPVVSYLQMLKRQAALKPPPSSPPTDMKVCSYVCHLNLIWHINYCDCTCGT